MHAFSLIAALGAAPLALAGVLSGKRAPKYTVLTIRLIACFRFSFAPQTSPFRANVVCSPPNRTKLPSVSVVLAQSSI